MAKKNKGFTKKKAEVEPEVVATEESTEEVVEEAVVEEAVKVAPVVVEAVDKTVKVYGLADKKVTLGPNTVTIKANENQDVPLDCIDALINMRLVTRR